MNSQTNATTYLFASPDPPFLACLDVLVFFLLRLSLLLGRVLSPDPPTPAFLEEKSKGNPEKSKGCSLRGTPKFLGKERKNTPNKQGKSETKKKTRKSKKARIGGSGRLSCPRNLLGSVFRRTDFSRIFIFEPPDFFADFVTGFFSFLWEKVPRKILLQQNPRQNPPKCVQQKSPTHFCREAGQILGISLPEKQGNSQKEKKKRNPRKGGSLGFVHATEFAVEIHKMSRQNATTSNKSGGGPPQTST